MSAKAPCRRECLRALAGGLLGGVIFPVLAKAQEGLKGAMPAAISGDAFRVGETVFKLADLLVPDLTMREGREEGEARLTSEAKAHLSGLIARGVEAVGEPESDRWQRRVGYFRARSAVDPSEGMESQDLTLQESVVDAGFARVHPQTDDHEMIYRLLQIEMGARLARRGLWASRAYDVFSAGDAGGAIGGFHLVEGRVVTASKSGPRVYFNFGEDFRSDFTATVRAAHFRRWRTRAVELENVQGRLARVRGIVVPINGPSIEITHEMQIEWL